MDHVGKNANRVRDKTGRLPVPSDNQPDQPSGWLEAEIQKIQLPERAGLVEETSIDQLQKELAETRDRLLRVCAELDNVRKRAAREREEERRYAALPLMRELLPVLDDLRRAVDAAQIASDVEEMIRGVEMIRRQLAEALARHGCREVRAEGRRFDPAVHEAVRQVPGDEEGMVLEVIQPGYMLHDRLVRPAKVVVCSGPARRA